MINDYVYRKRGYDNKLIPCQIIGINRNGCTVEFDNGRSWSGESIGDIEPIPLTPEILEKIGAIRDDSNDFVLFDNSKSDITGEYYIIRYHTEAYRLWICKGDGILENEIRIDCKFFHELQHALRLANINKEIVL